MLVHNWDDMDHHDAPWDLCPSRMWCRIFRSRVSVSLINKRQPHLFNPSVGGFVVAPAQLLPTRRSISCLWAYDAGTMGMGEGGCQGNGQCSSPRSSFCWWASNQLAEMMEQQEAQGGTRPYNELILNGAHWRARLPAIIEGVFYPRGSPGRSPEIHRRFMQQFALSEGEVPLLELDLANGDAPFRVTPSASL